MDGKERMHSLEYPSDIGGAVDKVIMMTPRFLLRIIQEEMMLRIIQAWGVCV